MHILFYYIKSNKNRLLYQFFAIASGEKFLGIAKDDSEQRIKPKR